MICKLLTQIYDIKKLEMLDLHQRCQSVTKWQLYIPTDTCTKKILHSQYCYLTPRSNIAKSEFIE